MPEPLPFPAIVVVARGDVGNSPDQAVVAIHHRVSVAEQVVGVLVPTATRLIVVASLKAATVALFVERAVVTIEIA